MSLIAKLCALAAILHADGSPLIAQDLRELSSLTDTRVLTAATAEDLEAAVTKGFRITDLEVESASPLRFSAVMVDHSGEYASQWSWHHSQTAAQIDSLLVQNQARLIDLEPYEVDGQTRFACLLVPNTGANAKAWWWYHGTNAGFIRMQASNHIARLIDVDRYQISGQTFYSAVMIANASSDARGWWWLLGVPAETISANIARNGSRVYDIELREDGSYDAILILDRVNIPHWSWWLDLTAAQLAAKTLELSERIIDIETEIHDGVPRFTVAMISNEREPIEPSLTVLGTGCGASIPHRQSAQGLPKIGSSVLYESLDASPHSPLLLILGFSAGSWGNLVLPLDLSSLGAPGCTLYTSVARSYATTSDAAGNANVSIPIPDDPGLVGFTFYTQFVALDSTANFLGLTLSDTIAATIGDR